MWGGPTCETESIKHYLDVTTLPIVIGILLQLHTYTHTHTYIYIYIYKSSILLPGNFNFFYNLLKKC